MGAVGDLQAADYLVVRRSVHRYARSKGLGFDDAEDVAQETLCRALERRIGLDCLLPWSIAVAGNLIADHHRRSSKLARAVIAAHPTSDPIEDVDDALWGREIARLVNGLPRKQAEILLKVAEGATVPELAPAMQASRRAVEGHLRRARRHLRIAAAV